MEGERRALYRHGALILLLGTCLGLLLPIQHLPQADKWKAAHVAGIFTGVLLFSIGGLWAELRLAPSRRRLALRLGLIAAWGGFVGQIYGAIVDLPGPVTEAGRHVDQPWKAIVFGVLMAVVVPATLGAFFLVWRGFAGKSAGAA
jgi:hypothetical protein